MLPAWEIKMLEAELEKLKQEREVKDNEAITRLAEYEGSGLSPEEVQELAKAKADGRLVVLPCKVGDTVYVIYGKNKILETKVDLRAWTDDDGYMLRTKEEWFKEKDIGKTVFLTHEEAEKVLEAKRRGGKKDDLQNYG